jgi:hypothetical protein
MINLAYTQLLNKMYEVLTKANIPFRQKGNTFYLGHTIWSQKMYYNGSGFNNVITGNTVQLGSINMKILVRYLKRYVTTADAYFWLRCMDGLIEDVRGYIMRIMWEIS